MGQNQAKFGGILAVVLGVVMGISFYGAHYVAPQNHPAEKRMGTGANSLARRDTATAPADTISAAELIEKIKPAKININTADVEQLMRIPGIGRTLATRIVNYRRRHGKFTSFGQLLKVKGIGRKKLAKIKKMATL